MDDKLKLSDILAQTHAPPPSLVARTIFSAKNHRTSLIYNFYSLKFTVQALVVCFTFIGGIFFSKFFLNENSFLNGESLAYKKVKFEYFHPEARNVAISGDFTQWENISLKPANGNGRWEVILKIKKNGRYKYIFIIDEADMFTDPKASINVWDGFGRQNSVLKL